MLELKDISMKAEDGKEILNHVDLTVEDSKLIVITGPNGGGKSTLAKIIVGIEKPSSGRVFFDGEDVTELDITQRAKLGISFAFQQPVRFKGVTVRDLINLAAGDDLNQSQLCSYLCDVGLCAKDYIDREVNASLSGGEMKRIEIATIMARRSKLAIFDEPEAGIDLWSFNNLIDVFNKIRHHGNGSTIIISHQDRILDIADERVVLSAGKIVVQGSKNKVLPRLLSNNDRCEFC